jgi:hypothetical protein
MNESSVSSKFQTDFRKAVPGAEVIKHADKSMIGMVDASITFNKRTLWIEYKFIGPKTKGVDSAFMRDGVWSPETVAEASPTQAAMARRLAHAGHCIYLFWVLDHAGLRKRVGYVTLWHPITGRQYNMQPNQVVAQITTLLRDYESLEILETPQPA